MATLTCSLNVTIPSTVTVTWLHNGSVFMTASSNDNTATLQIGNLQPSDAGVYQCVFNDTAGYVLRRNTNLMIVGKLVILTDYCVCVCARTYICLYINKDRFS